MQQIQEPKHVEQQKNKTNELSTEKQLSSPMRKLRLEHKQSLVQETGINLVNQEKKKLDNLIDDLNGKLVNHFKMKEEALLNQYKQQLVQQQKRLNELKNNTNEEQIKAKMLERKSELEKERNHLIQTNMFFSKKCEQYKQHYSQLVQEAQDLQRQIKFLDQQIDAANAKRVSMIEQSEKSNTDRLQIDSERNELPLFSEKKLRVPEEYTERKEKPETTERLKQSQSMRKIAKSLHVANFSKSGTKSGTQLKNLNKINPQTFEKGVLEKLFEESVEEVKNRRKSKRTMPNLKGEQFTEYQKRAIMQIFLSNEEVKKKIYQIIFQNNDKMGRGAKGDPMIKISFEEIGM